MKGNKSVASCKVRFPFSNVLVKNVNFVICSTWILSALASVLQYDYTITGRML